MHILKNDTGTDLRPHSNILCGCPHCKRFDHASTVITPGRSTKPSLDDTIPGRFRPAITMQEDDCIRRFSVDTETLEHFIEYVNQDGVVIMTQTVNEQIWALYESPFAHRRLPRCNQ